MAPPFPHARFEVDYPLYAVQFDPEDANRLAVGGGGGAGRSGVGNKISILETATQEDLRLAGEINLSRDEDSVMSLAFGPRKGKTSYLFAGVNSSPADVAKGKNQHLRTLCIEQSRARASAGVKAPEAKMAELARAALFADPDDLTYQRLLRVCGSIGAAATALGKEPQLAVFDASASGQPVKPRGVLELPREAEDLDIVQTGPDQYQVAFCYKYEMHVVTIGGPEDAEPELVYTMPEDNGVRPAFRSIRYLSPGFIMAAANLPKQSGIILMGLRMPTPKQDKVRLAATATIQRKIAATALAVANLSPPPSPAQPVGDTQFAIAVAGQDSSISLYTITHQTGTNINFLIDLHPFYTLTNVHPNDNITGLAFSPFSTPKTHLRPQFIKLASTSLQKSVAVHSIPLKKHVDKTPRNRKGPPRPVRYIVAMPHKKPAGWPVILFVSFFVLIAAIGGQTLVEIYGNGRPILHAKRLFPAWSDSFSNAVAPEPLLTTAPPPTRPDDDFIAKIAGDLRAAAGETLVLREADHDDVSGTAATTIEVTEEEHAPDSDAATATKQKKITVDVHDEEAHGPGKQWEELSEEHREAWREKLQEAGHWTAGMGETVFRGVLFGELAGVVGRAVGG